MDAALLADATASRYAEVVKHIEPAVAARLFRAEALGRYRFEHDLYLEARYQNLETLGGLACIAR